MDFCLNEAPHHLIECNALPLRSRNVGGIAPVQVSVDGAPFALVFLSRFNRRQQDAQLQRCVDKLQALMDERYNDVRAYPLPQRGLHLVLGASALPEGIVLGSLPTNWQQGTPL